MQQEIELETYPLGEVKNSLLQDGWATRAVESVLFVWALEAKEPLALSEARADSECS